MTVAFAIMVASVVAIGAPAIAPAPAQAATTKEIDAKAQTALTKLYNSNPSAREVGHKAKGILVFPEITKGGVGIGGSYGEGVLLIGGKPVEHYSVGAGTLGVTLGAQSYSQAIMFMTNEALQKFRASNGWEAGVDGSVVGIDAGAAKSLDTFTAQNPVIGFIFDQKGLMVDASFGGMKYSKIPQR